MLAPPMPAQQQPMPQGPQPAAPMMPPMGQDMGQPMEPPQPVKMYDVKIKRCIADGQLRVEVLAPEDFLIERTATRLDEHKLRFCSQRCYDTRSDLRLKFPDKKAVIDDLQPYRRGTSRQMEQQARDSRFIMPASSEGGRDKTTDLIEYYESYIKADYDGDGVAEWRQVVSARGASGRQLLANKEWGGDLPFTDLIADPMPHRWAGRSVFDETYDIQRIKTVLLRQALDNLYQVNNPMQTADVQRVKNPDALVNRQLGATIWTNGDPNAAIGVNAVPFVAKDTFPVLEYLDQVKEGRTGIGRASQALDPDVLQNQTATSAQITQDIKFSKVEVYARNLAEAGGMKRLFKCLLRLFVENQRKPRTIRLRGEFIEMDPRGWNADMDCTVNTGLGAGSRDRDMAMLQGVAQKQELAIQGFQDPFNPWLNAGHLFETYRKLSESAGLRNPEKFFPEITQQQVQQVAAQKAQNPPPNPEAQKAQAQMQIEQAKLQASQQSEAAKMQADQQRQQMEFQRETQMMQQKAEIEKIQAQADIATQDRKMQAEIQLAREKAQLDSALQQQEHALKLELMQREDARKDREFSLRQAEAQANHQRAGEAHGQKLEQMAAAQKAKPKAKDE